MFVNTVNNGLALHNIDAEAHNEMGWIQAEDSEPGSPIIINADTLNGKTSSDFFSSSGGELQGSLTVKADSEYSKAQVRNIILLTEEPTEDIGEEGDICIIISE